MYVAQRSMMYFPDTAAHAASRCRPARRRGGRAGHRRRREGDRLAPAAARQQAGGALFPRQRRLRCINRVDRFRALTGDGTGLVALSYRGYGGSTGSPTEPGLIADATAAYEFAAARYPAERIVLFGESLGTGVAVALAADRKVGRVILQAPFTSAAEIGAAAYPFLPVRLLMKDQFRSDERIGKVKVPLLILHGAFDRVVPMALGERLLALANEPKRLVRFPRGGHNDLDSQGAQGVVREFLSEMQ